MENGIVSRITEGYFRYQAWPTVCRDGEGTIYVAASGHRLSHICPFGKDVLYVSRDEGNTWTPPVIINDTCLDDRDAGLTWLGGKKFLLTYFNHPPRAYAEHYREKILRYSDPSLHEMILGAMKAWESRPELEEQCGSFTRLSTDGCMTWSRARRCPLTAPHGPIRLRSGALLFLGVPFHAPGLCDGNVYAMKSTDEGETWQTLGMVPNPAWRTEKMGFYEPYAAELSDGNLLGMIRVEEGNTRTMRTWRTFSADGGLTWTEPEEFGICGSPPHLLVHSSGAVVFTYARRTPPCGERARVSFDGGRTFGEEIVLGAEAPDWDHGYPSSVELSDGRILTVYYQKYGADPYNSLLFTKWELPAKP